MKSKIISFSLLLFLFSSLTKAQDWEFVGLDSLAIYHLSVSGDTIYAGTIDRNNNPNINDGLYFTSNGGDNWFQLDSTLGNGYVNGLYVISPENLFILKSGTICKTINSGQSWSPVNNISTNPIKWFGISPFNPNEIFAIDVLALGGGRYFNTLYKSTDRGNSWEITGSFPGSSHGSEITFAYDMTDSMNLYVSVDDKWTSLYFFKSTDEGNNWFYVSSPPFLPNDIYTDKIIPNRVYLLGGPYISTNGGLSWFLVDSGLTDNSYYLSFFQDQITTNLLYLLESDGLYTSHGDTFYWQKMDGSENLPLDLPPSTRNMKNIIIDGGTRKIYLGTSSGIYRKSLITGLPIENTPQINEFILDQNYPNPFNSSTIIEYSVNSTSFVSVKVYDVLGREIATMVNERKEAGSYSITFNASYLPSGSYIYRLIAGNSTATKKLILLK